MTTELTVEGGMHIEPDPKTGAIAASQVNEDTPIEPKTKDDQPEQTPAAEAAEPKEIVNPRDAIMKGIYEGRAKQFKEELEYAAQISGGATIAPASDDPLQQPASDEPAAAVEPKVIVKEQIAEPQQPRPKKQYIINGQSIELTEEELAQLASRSLQQTQAYLQQQQMMPRQQAQPIPPQQPTISPADMEVDRLREISRRITYGSEEESIRALRDFADHTARSVQRAAGPAPEQIAAYAAQAALSQVQFQTNLDTIAREYPDVFEKRSATLVAADYVNSLRNKYSMLGAAKPDIELYREACQMARTEFKPTQPNAPQSVTRPQTVVQVAPNRLERKRTAPQTPASVSRVLPSQSERAETGSDIVEKMRKARGQSAMN